MSHPPEEVLGMQMFRKRLNNLDSGLIRHNMAEVKEAKVLLSAAEMDF